MSVDNNRKGKAKRSKDRNERYSTHLPVLKLCISLLGPDENIFCVEHGMGYFSTTFFHSLENVEKITSFERETEWAKCTHCEKTPNTNHEIMILGDDLSCINDNFISNAKRTLAIVDGYATQRIKIVELLMKNNVQYIIEHDAETFSRSEIDARKSLIKTHDYDASQYVMLNPETLLYTKDKSLTLNNDFIKF